MNLEPILWPMMAFGITKAIVERYTVAHKIEVRSLYFFRRPEVRDESCDKQVINVVVHR